MAKARRSGGSRGGKVTAADRRAIRDQLTAEAAERRATAKARKVRRERAADRRAIRDQLTAEAAERRADLKRIRTLKESERERRRKGTLPSSSIKAMRRALEACLPDGGEVTVQEVPAGEPGKFWLALAERYAGRDSEVSYDDLARAASRIADDAILEVQFGPRRLARLIVGYSDPDSKLKPEWQVVSIGSISTWSAMWSRAAESFADYSERYGETTIRYLELYAGPLENAL